MRLAAEEIAPLTPEDVADICAGFQLAVTDIVTTRSGGALGRFRDELPEAAPTLVVAGGVAANQAIGDGLRRVAAKAGARLVVPPIPLCTDNGAMVAWAGAERLALSETDGFEFSAKARWPLDSADMGRRHAA